MRPLNVFNWLQGSARLHARARYKMSSEIVLQIEYRLFSPHLIVSQRGALSGSTMFMSCKICSHMCDVAKKSFHFYNHNRCKSLILLVAFHLPRAQHMTTPHSRRKAEHEVDRCQHNHARFETRRNQSLLKRATTSDAHGNLSTNHRYSHLRLVDEAAGFECRTSVAAFNSSSATASIYRARIIAAQQVPDSKDTL